MTANMAVRNTAERFDLRFPKTGGGEDIDFCIRAYSSGSSGSGGRSSSSSSSSSGPMQRVVSVPDAAARHPWWNGGRHSWRLYRRVYGWALGDGQLLVMYPRYTYWAAPSATELCVLLLLLALLLLILPPMLLWLCSLAGGALLPALHSLGGSSSAAPAAGGSTLQQQAAAAAGAALSWLLPQGLAGHGLGLLASTVLQAAQQWPWAAAAVLLAQAALAVKASDMALDVARNCLHPARRRQQPCDSVPLRVVASAVSSVIKTASEAGRLACQVRLGRPWAVGHRFDWFCGMDAAVVVGEGRRAAGRFCCYVSVVAVVLLGRAVQEPLSWAAVLGLHAAVTSTCGAVLLVLE